MDVTVSMSSRAPLESANNKTVSNIAYRVLWPFIVFVVFVQVGVSAGAYWLHWRDIDADTAAMVSYVQVSYGERLQENAALLESLMYFAEQDGEIQRAWKNTDRKSLFEAAQSQYAQIKRHDQVTHFYFHTLDQVNFLRMHNPPRHGDTIERYTLEQAAESGQMAWGVELGLFGQFVLRVVKPWMIDGRRVGYIELGKEIEHLTEQIKRTTGADLALVVDKQYIDRGEWTRLQKRLGRRGDWDQFSDKLVIDRTLSVLPKQLRERIESGREDTVNLVITNDNQTYNATALPAADARGQVIGSIWMLRNITAQYDDLQQFFMVFVLSGMVLSVGAVLAFYAYLNNIQSRLEGVYGKLRHEISEREMAQKQLESYSYSLAHDLRAPLRSITSFGQVLEEEAGDRLDGEAKDALQRVIRAGHYMARLIDDILKLSRIARKQMRYEEVDLSRHARAVIERLNTRDPRRNLHWRVDDNLTVRACGELLSLVIENLLENAWKFTSKKESVSIHFGKTDLNGETVYFVRDNGVGFDMQYVDKIFGVFQRLHTMGEYPGTGVGLAMVRSAIERHRGRVWAESQPDESTTVYFTVPA